MTRDEWRRLCEKTPKGNSGQPRPFWQSTKIKRAELPDGRVVFIHPKGDTYRKKMGSPT